MVHGSDSDRVKKYFARFGLSWNNFQSGHGLKMMGILSVMPNKCTLFHDNKTCNDLAKLF